MQDTFDDLYSQSKQGHAFYNLYDIITDERNIQLAYRNIKSNKGNRTPGVNRKTIINVNKMNADDYIEYVRKRFQNFHPHRVKRIHIPKKNGKLRPLGIPTIEDKLLQQCIYQVLEPICEAKFYPYSFGFRPNRNTLHAIAELTHKVNISRLYYVVDVDIEGFFDNISHGKLLKQLWTMGIRDKRVISIISKMLKAEIEGEGVPTKGTPQGGVLSPLLANVCLNEFDWWIDTQWRSFTAKELSPKEKQGKQYNSYSFAKLRKSTKLKEMYIVRYADDFKILCHSQDIAERIFEATKLWLKDRLGLEVSEEKSKITDIRTRSTEFLGFSLKAKPKGKTKTGDTKYVLYSHMTEQAIAKSKDNLRKKILDVKSHPTAQKVMLYNATVIGLQNYYDTATHCNLDFGRIEYDLMKFRYNRLKGVMSDKGTLSKTYLRRYKGYNYRKQFVASLALFPIPAVRHRSPMLFSQEICKFTAEGRAMIHSNLRIDVGVLRHIMSNPPANASIQYSDNRVSLYAGQYGRCGVSEIPLQIGFMECHHKIPKERGGTDEHKNLIWLCSEVHILVRATDEGTIKKYLNLVNLTSKQVKQLNKLRVLSGFSVIEQK